MSKTDLKNFPFEYNGQKLWYSRSLACATIILRYDKYSGIDVLAVKRGPGCEFNKGKWNVPGGFIDFDEDARACAIRETKEETGLLISPADRVCFLYLDTTPQGFRQTMVAVHYVIYPKASTEDMVFTDQYSEPGEVEEVRWINVKDLDQFDWTRGQIENINRVLNHVKLL